MFAQNIGRPTVAAPGEHGRPVPGSRRTRFGLDGARTPRPDRARRRTAVGDEPAGGASQPWRRRRPARRRRGAASAAPPPGAGAQAAAQRHAVPAAAAGLALAGRSSSSCRWSRCSSTVAADPAARRRDRRLRADLPLAELHRRARRVRAAVPPVVRLRRAWRPCSRWLIGYPLAYAIAFKAGRWRNLLLVLVIAPFFTSFILRTIAWKQILADDGLGRRHAARTCTCSPPDGRLTRDAVRGRRRPDLQLPAVHDAAALREPRAARPAADRGGAATCTPAPVTTFRKVTLPLSMPGVVAGTLLTFIPAAGDYVNAALLGNPSTPR